MKKRGIAVAVIACAALATGVAEAKKNVLRVTGGAEIDRVGLVLDASYDPRLDTLCPGYKVINVAILNHSMNILQLNPDDDLWQIKLSGERRPFKAIHNLRTQDPKAWQQLPDKAKEVIGYPLAVPIGGREVVDLFVPDTLDLERFNELDVTLKALGGRLEVLVSQ